VVLLTRKNSRYVTALGCGLLIGTTFIIIIPEGFHLHSYRQHIFKAAPCLCFPSAGTDAKSSMDPIPTPPDLEPLTGTLVKISASEVSTASSDVMNDGTGDAVDNDGASESNLEFEAPAVSRAATFNFSISGVAALGNHPTPASSPNSRRLLQHDDEYHSHDQEPGLMDHSHGNKIREHPHDDVCYAWVHSIFLCF
jgi:hypothetical protein